MFGVDFSQVPQMGPVADGQYRVSIVRLEKRAQREEKGGREYLTVTLTLPDEPTADDVDNFIAFVPDAQALARSDKAAIKDANRIIAFCKAFNLDPNSLEFTEGERSLCPNAVGATAIAVLTQKQGQNGTVENQIRSFIASV